MNARRAALIPLAVILAGAGFLMTTIFVGAMARDSEPGISDRPLVAPTSADDLLLFTGTMPASTLAIMGSDGRVIDIRADGTVLIPDGMAIDAASMLFWEAVGDIGFAFVSGSQPMCFGAP